MITGKDTRIPKCQDKSLAACLNLFPVGSHIKNRTMPGRGQDKYNEDRLKQATLIFFFLGAALPRSR